MAQFELETAKAALARFRYQFEPVQPPNQSDLCRQLTVRFLRVFQEDASVVVAGTALLELGDPLDLEIEIDVLSTDAVRISQVTKFISNIGAGRNPLEAVVRLVEPSAFSESFGAGRGRKTRQRDCRFRRPSQ